MLVEYLKNIFLNSFIRLSFGFCQGAFCNILLSEVDQDMI